MDLNIQLLQHGAKCRTIAFQSICLSFSNVLPSATFECRVIEPFCWARKLLEKFVDTKNNGPVMMRKISMLVADLSIISKFQIKLNVFSISSGSNKKLLQTRTLSVSSSLTKIIISGRRNILHPRLRPHARAGLITAKIRKGMGRLFMQLNESYLIIKKYIDPGMNYKGNSFRANMFTEITEIASDFHDHKLSMDHSLEKPVEDSITGYEAQPCCKGSIDESSQRQKQRKYAISFEDGFMEEHQTAFKKQTENFIESSFKFDESNEISFETEGLFSEELEFEQFSKFERITIEKREHEKFIEQIQKQEYIDQLFRFICAEVPKKIASQLLFICEIAWEARSQFLKKNYCLSNQIEIMGLVKEILEGQLEKLYSDQRINFLNLRKAQKSQLNSDYLVKKAFKSYLQFFMCTSILIMEGYFANPYTESEEARRMKSFRLEQVFENDGENNSSSSTESIQYGLPKKRMH